MSTTNDGGPAFPELSTTHSRDPETGNLQDVYTKTDPGMTLRDYFAAKAMQAILSTYVVNNLGVQLKDDFDSSHFNRELALDYDSKLGTNDGAEEIATDAYTFADAMLAARKAVKP